MSRYYRSFLEESVILPSYTARTTAFASATAITDTTILNALNTFDLGLISNGIDTKMKALYPFVGGTATTHKFNFMNTALKELTFSGGWIHSVNGIQGNGTNAFADTGVSKSDWASPNSLSFGVYSRTNIQGILADIGTDGGSDDINMFAYASGGNWYRVGGYDGSFVSTGTNSLGLFVGNRIDASTVRCLSNGTITSKTVAQSFINPANILIAKHFSFYSPREYAFTFFADSLTDTNLNDLNTLTQAFQTSLSRQV